MANLSAKSARRRLKARGEPYWRTIRRGVALGYRRPKEGAGTWIGRYFSGGIYDRVRLAAADDFNPADGKDILNFAQAMQRANNLAIAAFEAPERKQENYTVAKACAAYLTHLEKEGRSEGTIKDVRYRINAAIVPALGETECADLTARQLRAWRNDLAVPNTRQKRATANRTWTVLRAALNLAYQHDYIASDDAWRKVKPFRGVDAPRERWLEIDEAKRLLAACEGDFRDLVEAALQTGARYSELIRLRVGDFDVANGTMHIRESKSGKSRDVVLTDAGVTFFKRLSKDKQEADLILTHHGKAWGKSLQQRPMANAMARAGLPPMSFHGLRHTWASLAVRNQVPLIVVAKNLGHTSTRMVEKHYGHLAQDYVAEAIRAGAPTFG